MEIKVCRFCFCIFDAVTRGQWNANSCFGEAVAEAANYTQALMCRVAGYCVGKGTNALIVAIDFVADENRRQSMCKL